MQAQMTTNTYATSRVRAYSGVYSIAPELRMVPHFIEISVRRKDCRKSAAESSSNSMQLQVAKMLEEVDAHLLADGLCESMDAQKHRLESRAHRQAKADEKDER